MVYLLFIHLYHSRTINNFDYAYISFSDLISHNCQNPE